MTSRFANWIILCLLGEILLLCACQKRMIETVIVDHPLIVGPDSGNIALRRELHAKYEWQELSAEIASDYQFDGRNASLRVAGATVKPFFEARDRNGKVFFVPLAGLLEGKELIFETGKMPTNAEVVSLQFHTDGAFIGMRRLVWRSYVLEDVKR
jgi:hypothetical protein